MDPHTPRLDDHERRIRALEHRQGHTEIVTVLYGISNQLALLNQRFHAMDARLTAAIADIGNIKASALDAEVAEDTPPAAPVA